MAGGVFLIQKDETLVAMTEQPYDIEDVLQVLLATRRRSEMGSNDNDAGHAVRNK